MKYATQILVSLATAAFLPAAADAVPMLVNGFDTPGCDVLVVPPQVEELGIGFPLGERIDAVTIGFSPPACPSSAVVGQPNYRIRITNFNNVTFNNVWYVADHETRITNVDGIVNNEQAFRIDNKTTDLNNPLVFESINPNGLFEPGEAWEFIIDGYTNTFGLQPSLYNQIGVPSGGPNGSSGNIIATVVPEPAGVALLILSGCALLARRRRS
jgi:hypothetical protein